MHGRLRMGMKRNKSRANEKEGVGSKGSKLEASAPTKRGQELDKCRGRAEDLNVLGSRCVIGVRGSIIRGVELNFVEHPM